MAEEIAELPKVQMPIISYKTFRTFVDRLRTTNIPPRIDKSIMQNMSGAGQTQMMVALKALGLIDPGGTPTPRLKPLVDASGGDGYKHALLIVLKSAYVDLFRADMDLTAVSPAHLRDAFVEMGMQGESARKAMAFFLYAAKDAGVALSQHLIHAKGFRTARPRAAAKRSVTRTTRNADEILVDTDEEDLPPPPSASWTRALLGKFPAFDPEWPAEVQARWFESFAKLMEMKPEGEE